MEKILRLVHLRYLKDEVLLVLETAIQGFFLFKHNASYAEFFYDFTRFNSSSDPLTKKQKILALIVTTLPAYIRAKLQKYFADIQTKLANYHQLKPSEKVFLKLFPWLMAITRGANFLLNAKYLLN